jgi:hypothetical protein
MNSVRYANKYGEWFFSFCISSFKDSLQLGWMQLHNLTSDPPINLPPSKAMTPCLNLGVCIFFLV